MKKRMCAALALVLLAGCAVSEASSGADIGDGAGEELYGTVTVIVGNELTVELGTLASGTDAGGMGERPEGSDGVLPEGAEPGEMPAGFNGEPPAMPAAADGEMPAFGEGDMPDRGQMDVPGFAEGDLPDLGDGELPQAMGGMGGSAATSLQSTGETATYMVPVDTPVTVSGVDTVTTFSKIAEGNILRFTVNSGGTITAIEILG